MKGLGLIFALAAVSAATAFGADAPAARTGDQIMAGYFQGETERIAENSLRDVATAADWTSRRGEYRRQLQEMLGLWPEPPRTDLKPVVTAVTRTPEFRVERLYFQSRPGLYVTGNLYVPEGLKEPAPAVLYVCGHGNVKQDGYSYGSKASYQHHGAWLARNGYVCLTIDTLQLGEIEGLHHGTSREGMWWWNSRGYTPAGVEAWNGIRALDYLQSRREVDGARLGITGRSGGGAYSWWVSALDDRVKCAIPVAGITDMQNHVVDGVIEGHCDCMFMVNTYRWDFDTVAALMAPRPLLIANSDKDTIFPLEGVVRTHEKVRRIYRLLGAADKLGLLITEGPHKDTQELQVPALHWLNRHLKNADPPLTNFAEKLFQPEQLRVYQAPPADQINTRIHETFVPKAPAPGVPASTEAWTEQRDAWLAAVRTRSLGAWPAETKVTLRPVAEAERQGVRLGVYEFESQPGEPLRLYVLQASGRGRAKEASLHVLDQAGWERLALELGPTFPEAQLTGSSRVPVAGIAELASLLERESGARVYLAPRGVGPTAWTGNDRKKLQIRRRFALLGATIDGMRAWDIRRAVQALRAADRTRDARVTIAAEGDLAGDALYASLYERGIARLVLAKLPETHMQGPELLGVLKVWDMPAALAAAAERCPVELVDAKREAWSYPVEVAKKLGWGEKRITFR